MHNFSINFLAFIVKQRYKDFFHDFSLKSVKLAINNPILIFFSIKLVIFDPMKQSSFHLSLLASDIKKTLLLPASKHGKFPRILPSPDDFTQPFFHNCINFESPSFFSDGVKSDLSGIFFHQDFQTFAMPLFVIAVVFPQIENMLSPFYFEKTVLNPGNLGYDIICLGISILLFKVKVV